MTKKVTEHSRKRRFNGFLKVDEASVSYERYDGSLTKRQKLLVLERGDAAAALVHDTRRKKVILTEQFRYPTFHKGPGWLIETVAGGIAEGETPEDCIRREILEEIGYRAKTILPIHLFYASPGGSTERIHLFYAPVKKSDLVNAKASGVLEEQEDIRRVEIPEMEFFKSLDRGEYLDAKLIIAGHWLRRHRVLMRRRKK